MPDVLFKPKAVRRRYQAYVQRRAVLWPLMGRRSMSPDKVCEDVTKLHNWWRTKVTALYNEGIEMIPTPGKMQFARNCPPTIIVTHGGVTARPCRLMHICPWCHSREAESLYDQLASYLPARNATAKPLNLLEVSARRVMTPQDAGKLLTPHLIDWKRPVAQVLKKLPNALGAYYAVNIEPRMTRGKRNKWLFSYHVLAVMPDSEFPADLDNGLRQCRLSTVISRKQLIPVIGRVCKYPVGLLRCEAPLVAMALNARKNIRCKASTGCLRGTTRSP
jgi:hypothetical protein